MAANLEIVDAHMHLWTPETHPWVMGVKDGGHPAGKFGKLAEKAHIYAAHDPCVNPAFILKFDFRETGDIHAERLQ